MDPEALVCAVVGFVLLGFMLWMMFLVANMISRTGRLSQEFRVAAKTLRGQFTPGGIWKRPSISLRYANTAGRLRIEKSSGIECTEFSLNWPTMSGKFEIISKRQSFKYRRADWVEAPLGVARLDASLRMRTPEPDDLARMFSEGVYWQLEKLQAFLPQRDIYCGCVRRQLVIRKWGVIKNAQELVQLVRLSFELYDQFQLTQVDGIDFVESMEATLLEEVDCPICGEAIERNLVTCTSCKTPHHRDCWDYNGRCATFACGQEVYARPAVARPIAPEPAEAADDPTPALAKDPADADGSNRSVPSTDPTT